MSNWHSRAEARILLDACRIAPAPTPAPAPTHPATDWEWLLDAAARHAVTPLLARSMAAQPRGGPPNFLATIGARRDENALRNIRLTQQLAGLLRRLAASGVDAMPIKGPALAISAYGDLSLREFRDLDIVVRPADFDRARSLFGEWGYRPLAELTSAGERALRGSDHHIPLVDEESRTRVELHWSLDDGRPGRSLDGEWVWANARSVGLLGSDVPSLSWSALLVYLCVHGAKHGWTRLGWIRDVAGVLSAAPAGELAAAAGLAADADARRRLALGVELARELLDPPPRDDLELSGDPEVTRLRREVHSTLFGEANLTLVQWATFQCRTFDRVRDRAGYWWHILLAPHVADVEAIALPAWLRGLYYVLRPVRLLARRAGALRPQRQSGPSVG